MSSRSVLLTSIIIVLSCISISSSWATGVIDAYKRPSSIPFPQDNPYSAEKAALGKMLFFEPRLSKNKNMTCATCHNPSFGWEDATSTSVGAQNTHLDRHTPTILNVAWGESFFWDGRAKTLEAQAQGPIESDVEMNLPIGEAVKRLKDVKSYREWFAKVFGREGITSENITKAIATFERTVVSGQAPFDLWVEGDSSAISAEAKRGFELFNGKARCSVCHSGWNFTDNKFHDIGLNTNDEGLRKLTNKSKDAFAFKTPSLRNISQRAPYMHNGTLTTLPDVINHYIAGGIPRNSLSPLMAPAPLTAQEVSELTAFLLTLTGKDASVSLPTLPL